MLFWFIVRAAMIPRFKLLLLFIVALVVCGLGGTEAVGQKLPKATGREPDNKAAPRPAHRSRVRSTTPATSRNATAVESENFLDLGDRFREQKKWKAAEAAYKEAVNVWPGNADAMLELGFIYLYTNRVDEAQQTYSKLKSLSASHASDLLTEINKRKH